MGDHTHTCTEGRIVKNAADRNLQRLADTQAGAAFIALCGEYGKHPQPVLDYLEDLDRADLMMLTIMLGRWFVTQLMYERADAVTSDEEAREQVVAEARAFATEYALRLHAAQEEAQ